MKTHHNTITKRRALLFLIAFVLLAASLACGSGASEPTATPEPPTILGTLIGPEGAIGGAEVSLKTYLDEACVDLAEAVTLPESERNQLDDCSGELPPVVSDAEGRYRFPEVPPGWYKLTFRWNLSVLPDDRSAELSSGISIALKDGFLISFIQTNETPATYSALAQGDIFYFSGMEDMVLDFNY